MSKNITEGKVTCKECGHKEHILVEHIAKKHMDPALYLVKYPDADLWSPYGALMIQEHSPSKKARMLPRQRKQVNVDELFPDFAKRTGHKSLSGTVEAFAQPGPLTPELDENYVFPIEQTLDLITILEKPKRNRPYVKGWSGTGKTQLTFNLAAKLNAEIMEWNGDSFQQRSSLIGQWTVKDGETVFEYGILPRAMRRGCWLVVNEIDILDPHTLNILKPLLEDPPRLTILENGGEVVEPHPDFRIIATANTWARGDSTGLFVNTHTQSDADARRWSARILLDYMEAKDEEAMLVRYFGVGEDGLDKDEPAAFVKVANKVRDAFKAGKIDKTFSPAELVNWVENFLVCAKGPHYAARLSFLNALEPDVQTAIGEMINAVFGPERGTATVDGEEEET